MSIYIEVINITQQKSGNFIKMIEDRKMTAINKNLGSIFRHCSFQSLKLIKLTHICLSIHQKMKFIIIFLSSNAKLNIFKQKY